MLICFCLKSTRNIKHFARAVSFSVFFLNKLLQFPCFADFNFNNIYQIPHAAAWQHVTNIRPNFNTNSSGNAQFIALIFISTESRVPQLALLVLLLLLFKLVSISAENEKLPSSFIQCSQAKKTSTGTN